MEIYDLNTRHIRFLNSAVVDITLSCFEDMFGLLFYQVVVPEDY